MTDECSFVCSSLREIAQRHPGNKKTVYYRTPCNKRLVSSEELPYQLEIVWKENVVGILMMWVPFWFLLCKLLLLCFFFRDLCWRWLITVSRTFSLAIIIFLYQWFAYRFALFSCWKPRPFTIFVEIRKVWLFEDNVTMLASTHSDCCSVFHQWR